MVHVNKVVQIGMRVQIEKFTEADHKKQRLECLSMSLVFSIHIKRMQVYLMGYFALEGSQTQYKHQQHLIHYS